MFLVFVDDRRLFGRQGNGGAVGDSADGALGIGTVGQDLEIVHFIDDLAVRVPVIVVHPAGDDRIARLHDFKEPVARRGGASGRFPIRFRIRRPR